MIPSTLYRAKPTADNLREIKPGKTMMPVRTLKDALPTGARTKTSFSSRKNSLPQSRVSCAKDSLHVLEAKDFGVSSW